MCAIPSTSEATKAVAHSRSILLVTLLAFSSSCIPLSNSDLGLLVAASPTARSCSLDEFATPVHTLEPSSTAHPPDIPRMAWSVYRDARFGYLFEYPAAYDHPIDPQCGLTVVNPISRKGQEVYVGSSVAMFIKEPQHPSWRDDACLLILDLGQDAKLSLLSDLTFAGEDALTVAFDATWNPNGREVLFQHGGFLYVIANIANPTCDIQEAGVNSDAVYQHMLESFRFLPD